MKLGHLQNLSKWKQMRSSWTVKKVENIVDKGISTSRDHDGLINC